MALCCLFACDTTPDPRTIEGMMGYAAIAIEEDDAAKLFGVIDVRARHAMISVVNDRRAAAEIVRRDYPDADRARTLEWLGDAAEVPDAAALFGRRCGEACREELASHIGAVVSHERVGDVERVTTTRGSLDLHREADGHWWGIVWRTDDLDDERNRASHDLAAVERNAATYRRRIELDEGEQGVGRAREGEEGEVQEIPERSE